MDADTTPITRLAGSIPRRRCWRFAWGLLVLLVASSLGLATSAGVAWGLAMWGKVPRGRSAEYQDYITKGWQARRALRDALVQVRQGNGFETYCTRLRDNMRI